MRRAWTAARTSAGSRSRAGARRTCSGRCHPSRGQRCLDEDRRGNVIAAAAAEAGTAVALACGCGEVVAAAIAGDSAVDAGESGADDRLVGDELAGLVDLNRGEVPERVGERRGADAGTADRAVAGNDGRGSPELPAATQALSVLPVTGPRSSVLPG